MRLSLATSALLLVVATVASTKTNVPKPTPYPVDPACPLSFQVPDIQIYRMLDTKSFIQVKVKNQGSDAVTVSRITFTLPPGGNTAPATFDTSFYRNQGWVAFPGTTTVSGKRLKITRGAPSATVTGGAGGAGGGKVVTWSNVVVPPKRTVVLSVALQLQPYINRQTANITATATYTGPAGATCSSTGNRANGGAFQLQGRINPETTWASSVRSYFQYWGFYGLCGEPLLPTTYFSTFSAARDSCAQVCETEWGGKHCTSFSIGNVRNSATNFSCNLFAEKPGNDLFWVSPVRTANVHNTANVTSFVKKNMVQQLYSFSGTCPYAGTLYPPF